MPEKCMKCPVYQKMLESNEPACCAWYIDNIVFGVKTVDDCPNYNLIIED